MSRPTHLDSRSRISRLLRLVAEGLPARQAAVRVGIAAKTYDRWQREAAAAERRQEEGLELTPAERKVLAFRVSVERTEAGWEARMVSTAIELAIRQGSARALIELLARHPATRERWNPPERIEVGRYEETPPLDEQEFVVQIERLRRIAQERLGRGQ